MKKKILSCLISISVLLSGSILVLATSENGTEIEEDVITVETTDISNSNSSEDEEIPQAPIPDNSDAQWVSEDGTVYNYFEAEELGLIQNYGVMPLASIVDVELTIEDVTHKRISAGKKHTLMINQDGEVYAWGENGYGELGNGTTTDSFTPVKVSGLTDVVDVCAGIDFSLALTSSGDVYSWGRNSNGRLGLGNTTTYTTPTKITAFDDIEIVKVSAMGYHSMALASNGDVYSWGTNYNGQLGIGDETQGYVTTPTKIPNLSAAIDIAAGEYSSMIVDLTGYVWGWGNNYSCQLGVVDSTNFYSPQKTTISGIEYISLGHDHCLAKGASGEVYAWGYNVNGQLGNSVITTSTPQAQEVSIDNAVEVWSGYEYSMAKTSDNQYYLWGRNDLGQLGVGSTEDKLNVPTLLDITYGFTSVYPEYNCTYAIDSSDNLYRWGYMSNTYYEDLTWDVEPLTTVNVPLDVQLANKFVQIESKRNGSIAVDQFGDVYTWGEGDYYDLGHGTDKSDVYYPKKVEGLPKIQKVAKGENHTLALDYDGNVWGWGNNSSGEVGLEHDSRVYVPDMIDGLSNITDISAGGGFSAAITSDGKVMTWGQNYLGQLGYTDAQVHEPKIVEELSNVSMISCGESSMVALSGKTIYTWGYNAYGQLGDGTTTNRTLPQAVSGEYKYVSSQRNHVLAIGYNDGKIYAWGSNTIGQLGTGDKVNRTTPTLLESDTQYSKVIAGYMHSLAIDTDGYVYGWGSSREGQLGLGHYDSMRTPTKLTKISNAKAITGGGSFSYVLTNNNDIFGFGNNAAGTLGLISNIPQQSYDNKLSIKLTNDNLHISGYKYISSDTMRVDIVTENGLIGATSTIDNIECGIIDIDIPCELSTGKYFIKISYDNQVYKTITLKVQEISKYFIENESISIPFVCNSVADLSGKVFSVFYETNKFELLSGNALEYENVEILTMEAGTVSFSCTTNNLNDSWSGIANIVDLKSKINENDSFICYAYEK